MLIKLLVSVFERAKAKLISNHRRTSESQADGDDWDFYPTSPSGLFIVEQPTRSTFSKWLCTTPSQIGRSSNLLKSTKVRRSSSWRSLKERTNNPLEQINSRTLSVDQLNRNGKKQQQKNNSLKKKLSSSHRNDFLQSTIVHFPSPCESTQPIRLSNCDASPRLSSYEKSSSTFHPYTDQSQNCRISRKSQVVLNRSSGHNTSSGGADSGYSEDSFQLTKNSSQRRPLHTSCPHCHCEQRSSTLNINRTSIKNLSSESSMSDLNIDKDLFYSPERTSLATSRSYPHIKPLPRTNVSSQQSQNEQEQQEQHQQRRTRTLTTKRRRRQAQRRHLSCDSSLIPKQAPPTQQQSIPLRSSPILRSPLNDCTFQRHFTTVGMFDRPRKHWNTMTPLPKTYHIFGELNLEAIELDSIRTIDYHRPSFSSTYSSSSSLTSSSSSLHTDKQSRKSRQSKKKSSKEKGTFLVWHEYQNPSLLSTTHGTKLFSVVRGDQVKLLRRIGKSMLLVEKQEDGSIGFLPQSCLADDQIHSFLSVKGLRETVL